MASRKSTKPSDSQAVDEYLKELGHPLAELAEEIRQFILATDRMIGEEIKWNAPAFFYTGAMMPFNPKEYRRHLIVFNFYRKDKLRLVFWRGDRAKDKSGFLEGHYPDGRRLATIASTDELRSRKKVLRSALKAQLAGIKEADSKADA